MGDKKFKDTIFSELYKKLHSVAITEEFEGFDEIIYLMADVIKKMWPEDRIKLISLIGAQEYRDRLIMGSNNLSKHFLSQEEMNELSRDIHKILGIAYERSLSKVDKKDEFEDATDIVIGFSKMAEKKTIFRIMIACVFTSFVLGEITGPLLEGGKYEL